jgi:hypothetical protein
MTATPLSVFTNAAITADTEMVLHTTRAETHHEISILFDQERLTIEFYDVVALERLRDIAAAGAARLRAAIETQQPLDRI